MKVVKSKKIYDFPSILPYQVEVLSVEDHGSYVVRTEQFTENKTLEQLEVAYTPEGIHIGSPTWAEKLTKLGIQPELHDPERKTAQIGFCDKEQRWYGWQYEYASFGIGTVVRRGQKGYSPRDLNDFVLHIQSIYLDSGAYAFVSSTWNVVREKVNKKKIRIPVFELTVEHLSDIADTKFKKGDHRTLFFEAPKAFGPGTWKAKTLEDARQMAIAVTEQAEGVLVAHKKAMV